ncbi:alpha-glucosidase [Robertmurraya yapensis]|uniref:Alpha-amylase n=1 Tax=Bacillus yapensis TaxID=2492960 RepID=A0A3S0KDN0_9BACI|nr:alpha-glucosidase [Bacillus yapensis]RTR28427.1 alpha-glucosidase [Bacillus yapensis]TKS94488.1 alpha,alpha-phosphotrehalase [Bacillus yapensis]
MQKIWWKETVAYQVYPRSFQDSNGDGIGDLRGLISKLDYIQELGIDVIWICPMYKSPNDDNGYDISDYQDIMEDFGTMGDFDELLQEVHNRGMKLIIDLVINHTSDEHQWFIESRFDKESEKRDWYIWRDGKNGQEPNNWGSIFGGSAWQLDEKTGQYYLHIFSKKQPDLNWENKEVRDALYQMVNWWLDKGVDGFRVDAISHIKKDPTFTDMEKKKGAIFEPAWKKYMNVPGILPFLEELKNETFAKYDIMTVAEANGVGTDGIHEWVDENQGKFNMIFQFEHLGLWDSETKQLDILELKKVLTRWQKALEKGGWNALFIENHDKARSVSTWGNDGPYWRESATALATMYFFMQGTPFIYQGQEIGMTNVKFPTLEDYNDVSTKGLYADLLAQGKSHDEIMEVIWATSRDNSRTPMQWSTEENAGFTTGSPWLGINPNYKEINVEQQQKDPNSILSYYKEMIRLRKNHETLVYGTYDLVLENDPSLYAYTRTYGSERVMVLSNLTDETVVVGKVKGVTYRSENLLLANLEVADHSDMETLELAPYEARIYKI